MGGTPVKLIVIRTIWGKDGGTVKIGTGEGKGKFKEIDDELLRLQMP